MNLYEVNNEIKQVLSTMVDEETGEVTESSLVKLQELKETIENKCVAIAAHIENLNAEYKAIGEAKKKLSERESRYKRQMQALKTYMMDNMEAAEIKKISCPYFDITLCKNPPSVIIYDEKQIPTKYERVIIETDKAKIREDLMQGATIPGAKLFQNQSLRIK